MHERSLFYCGPACCFPVVHRPDDRRYKVLVAGISSLYPCRVPKAGLRQTRITQATSLHRRKTVWGNPQICIKNTAASGSMDKSACPRVHACKSSRRGHPFELETSTAPYASSFVVYCTSSRSIPLQPWHWNSACSCVARHSGPFRVNRHLPVAFSDWSSVWILDHRVTVPKQREMLQPCRQWCNLYVHAHVCSIQAVFTKKKPIFQSWRN